MSNSQNQAGQSSHSSESGPASSRPEHISSSTKRPLHDDVQSSALHHDLDKREENKRSADSYGHHQTEQHHKKRRHRSSGGFLLDSINIGLGNERQQGLSNAQGGKSSHHARHRRAVTEGQHEGHDRKGKGKARASIGKSPLGIEMMNHEDPPPHEEAKHTRSHGDVEGAQLGGQEPDIRTHSVFGSDQAQIVNLALSLSENRRRQFSAGRLLPTDPVGSPRVASSGFLPPATPALPIVDEGLRQRLRQERRGTRTPFLGYETALQSKSPRDSLGTQDLSSSEASSLPPLLSAGFNAADTSTLLPSEATLLRVEKAKTAIELSYEYRRLLQYLPKIPAAQDARPPTGRPSSRQTNAIPGMLGRSYNPLQYIRNRKVRGRERSLLNAEAEGWRNIEAVRGWVDKVAEERQRDSSDSVEESSLPPFPPAPELSLPSLRSPGIDSRSAAARSSAKELRPRVDWMTTPWNMLADSYWLEQAGNKFSIEDQKGRRVFSAPRPKAFTHSGLPNELQRPSSRRSMSIPRSLKGLDRATKPDVTNESAIKERGRPRHKRLESFTSGHEYSSSQDRRSGWRRRLMRPNSPSSSEESGPAAGEKAPKLKDRATTAQQRQSNLVLEKQIARLIAREAESKELELDEQKHDLAAKNKFKEEDVSVRLPAGAKDAGAGDKERHHLHEDRSKASIPRPQTPPNRRPSRTRASRVGTEPFEARKNGTSSSHHATNIAINVSPPQSPSRRRTRPSSPSSPELLSTPPERRSMRSIQDLANPQHRRSVGNPSSADLESTQSPKTDSSVGYLSPQSAGSFGRLRKNAPGDRQTKSKDSKDFESRLRGLLKGTKIADIVGNPVAKVGDLIWKKDSNDGDAFRSPVSTTPDASDVDESEHTSPEKNTQQVFEDQNPSGSRSRPELPVFRSPFRNRENWRGRADTAGLQRSPEIGETRKSDRFAQRAPPPLDMRSISPSPVGSRIASPEDPKRTLNEKSSSSIERQRDQGKMMTERRHAIANNLTNPPRRQQTLYETAVEPQSGKIPEWPTLDPLHFINVTERLLSPIHTKVTKIDVERLHILSESAAVVTSRIMQQVAEVRELGNSGEQPLTRGKGSHANVEGKILEARTTITSIRYKNEGMQKAVGDLSSQTVSNFVKQLKDIEHKISHELTPIVRTSGNEADRLGSELATTRTLELKRLNDSIDLFIRRKRRRFRWLRRGVYLLLEWTLLGFMWWAWLMVVIIKTARASVRGVFAAIRWLLWL